MTKTIRLAVLSLIACVFQTTLTRYISIAGVAPDLMITFLVLATSYTGLYGGFCIGALIGLMYDASVGYVPAINLIGYTAIGWGAVMIRRALDEKLAKLPHNKYLVLVIIAFFWTICREILYIGYLYLIGAEQSWTTLARMLFCAGYTAIMVFPCALVVRFIMNTRPSFAKKHSPDIVTENHR